MTSTIESNNTYDDFTGEILDPARWVVCELPQGPDLPAWQLAEPSASTTVADGVLTIEIERFERSHDIVHAMDNPKHLLISTEQFPVPRAGRTTVSSDVSAVGINGAVRDYRDGFAALNVLDLSAAWVFDAAVSHDAVLSVHERLAFPGIEHPFTRIVESPLAGLDTTPGLAHRCEVTLNPAHRTVQWHIDGTMLFEVRDVDVPESINIGLGIFTLHPIINGRSSSLRGQGFRATFGPVTVSYG